MNNHTLVLLRNIREGLMTDTQSYKEVPDGIIEISGTITHPPAVGPSLLKSLPSSPRRCSWRSALEFVQSLLLQLARPSSPA